MLNVVFPGMLHQNMPQTSVLRPSLPMREGSGGGQTRPTFSHRRWVKWLLILLEIDFDIMKYLFNKGISDCSPCDRTQNHGQQRHRMLTQHWQPSLLGTPKFLNFERRQMNTSSELEALTFRGNIWPSFTPSRLIYGTLLAAVALCLPCRSSQQGHSLRKSKIFMTE